MAGYILPSTIAHDLAIFLNYSKITLPVLGYSIHAMSTIEMDVTWKISLVFKVCTWCGSSDINITLNSFCGVATTCRPTCPIDFESEYFV